jgi:hypothetical protein
MGSYVKKHLLTICYVSTSAGRLTASDIEALLEQSRSRNALNGVTGLLLYADGNFIQYIEGKPEGVEPIWTIIQRDPRHKNVSGVFKKHRLESCISGLEHGVQSVNSYRAGGTDSSLARANNRIASFGDNRSTAGVVLEPELVAGLLTSTTGGSWRSRETRSARP